MTAGRQVADRYRLAPVSGGAAVWELATDLVLAPIRLSSPAPIVLAPRPGGAR